MATSSIVLDSRGTNWDYVGTGDSAPKSNSSAQSLRGTPSSAHAQSLRATEIPTTSTVGGRRWFSKRMGRCQILTEHWTVQLCLLALAVAHCVCCVVEEMEGKGDACLFVHATGWPLLGTTCSEFLIRVMAQAGHIYLPSTWRRFVAPLYHKVDVCVVVATVCRIVFYLRDCDESSSGHVENYISPTGTVTIFFVLVHRFMMMWAIYYCISVDETEKMRKKAYDLIHDAHFRLAEASWPEDFRAIRTANNAEPAVRLQTILNKTYMQGLTVMLTLLYCTLYVLSCKYADSWDAPWIMQATEPTGYMLVFLLSTEFIVRCIAQRGEQFFLSVLHKAEALLFLTGGSFVLYATLNNAWMRAGGDGWLPDPWLTTTILSCHRIIRFFGIVNDVSRHEYGVASVLDAKAIKLFMRFVGDLLDVSPQNVHFKVPGPTHPDVEVWIMKATLKSEAFESLHLPIGLRGGLIEELFIKLPRPAWGSREEEDVVTNVRVKNFLLLVGPGGGLAEAGRCSAEGSYYWTYENVLDAKSRLVELISQRLRFLVNSNPPQSGKAPLNRQQTVEGSPSGQFAKSGHQNSTVESSAQVQIASGRTEDTAPSKEPAQQTSNKQVFHSAKHFHHRVRHHIHKGVKSRVDWAKEKAVAFAKEWSVSHVVVSIDNIMLQYEDIGEGHGDHHATLGVKVGNISVHRHQDNHITCDVTRAKVLMQVQRAAPSERDVGFWWEDSHSRLSTLLSKHPGKAMKQMKKLNSSDWFRLWFFEALDRQLPISDQRLHRRVEKMPERYEIFSVLRVSLTGHPKYMIKFDINGERHFATVVAVRECHCRSCQKKKGVLEDLPEEFIFQEHVMTHQLKFLSGACAEEKTRWVYLDEKLHLLSDCAGNDNIPYEEAHSQEGQGTGQWTRRAQVGLKTQDVRSMSMMNSIRGAASNSTFARLQSQVFGVKKQKEKEVKQTASWVYTIEISPIRFSLESEQVCYLHDTVVCLQAWIAYDNAFKWRPAFQAEDPEDLGEYRSTVARLWWMYAVHRVLAQRRVRLRASTEMEVTWRSSNLHRYNDLIAEVAKRSKGDYQAMKWDTWEQAWAKELEVRLTLGDIITTRRNVLQNEIAAQNRTASFLQDFKMAEAVQEMQQNVAERMEGVGAVCGHVVDDAAAEVGHRVQEKIGGVFENLDRLDLRASTARGLKTVRMSMRRGSMIKSFTVGSPSHSADSEGDMKATRSMFGRMSLTATTSIAEDAADSAPERETNATENYESNKHNWLRSIFVKTPRPNSAAGLSVSASGSGMASCSSTLGSATGSQQPGYANHKSSLGSSVPIGSTGINSLASDMTNLSSVESKDRKEGSVAAHNHGFLANLAGEWQIHVKGIDIKLLDRHAGRSLLVARPRDVLLHAKLSGLYLDLCHLMLFKESSLEMRHGVDNDDRSVLLPHSGMLAIEKMSVTCPEAKRLIFFGRRDIACVVRSVKLPACQRGFLSGSELSALAPMPEWLAFAARVGLTPHVRGSVELFFPEANFVLYEPLFLLLLDFLRASAIKIDDQADEPFDSEKSIVSPKTMKSWSTRSRSSTCIDRRTGPPRSWRASPRIRSFSIHRQPTGNFAARRGLVGPFAQQVDMDSSYIEPEDNNTFRFPGQDAFLAERARLRSLTSAQRFFERLTGTDHESPSWDIELEFGAIHFAQVGKYSQVGRLLVEEYRMSPWSSHASRCNVEDLSIAQTRSAAVIATIEEEDDSSTSSMSCTSMSRATTTAFSVFNGHISHVTTDESVQSAPVRRPLAKHYSKRCVAFESKDFDMDMLMPWNDPKWPRHAEKIGKVFHTMTWTPSLENYLQVSVQGGLHTHASTSVVHGNTSEQRNVDDKTLIEGTESQFCDAGLACSCSVSARMPVNLLSKASRPQSAQENPPVCRERSLAEFLETGAEPAPIRNIRILEESHGSKTRTAFQEHVEEWSPLTSVVPSGGDAIEGVMETAPVIPCWSICTREASQNLKQTPVVRPSKGTETRLGQFSRPSLRQTSTFGVCCWSPNETDQELDASQDSRARSEELFMFSPLTSRMFSHEGTLPEFNLPCSTRPCIEMSVRIVSCREFARGWLEREANRWHAEVRSSTDDVSD